MADLNTEIKIGADASGVEAGVSKAKRSLKDLGDAASRAGKDAGAGIGSIGAGGDKSAKDVERATRSMQASLQRLLAEQKAGAKGSREYWEALANARGVNKSAIKPILDQLDAAKAKTLSAKAASESWMASLGRVGPGIAAAFAATAAVAFVGKLVAVQREFDVLNSSLKTVTGSSEAAEREMAWLKDFAKTTPFGLAQATQGFVKMKALGLDPTRAALTSFGNTASAMGKGLDQMIEAVADASTGEFERLKEFGIKAKKDGDSVSLTFRGVTTTIKNSAQEITQYLEGIGNVDFAGAMAERAKTLDGAISGLGDTWDELFRTVSTNNVGSLIFDSVTLANGALEDATTILRALGGAAQDAGRDTGALSTIQSGLATAFETVAVLGANVAYVLKQTGNEIGGLVAQIAQFAKSGGGAFMLFDVITKGRSVELDAIRSIRKEMVADAEEARRQIDATEKRVLGARSAIAEYNKYATRNASAATDPRRVDLGGSAPRSTGGTGGTKSGAGANAAAAAIKAEQSAYENLITSIKTKIELDKAELAGNAALTESQQMRVKLDADMVGGRLKLSAAHEQEVRTALAALGVSEALMKARKLELEQATAAAEAYASALESRQAAAESVADQIAQERESIATMGLSKTAVVQLEAAKLSETAATKLRLAAIADEIDWSGKLGDAYRAEAAQLMQLADLKREGAAKQASVDAAEAASKEWDKTADNIESALTDALMRGFESGKGFGENLGDSISNYFKTTVAKEIAAAITRAIMSAMASTQWGRLLSGVLGGGTGGGTDWLSMATKAYDAYTKGGAGGAGGAGGVAAAGGAYATTGGTGYAAGTTTSYSAGSVSINAGMVNSAGTAGASTAGTSMMTYAGYAALIVAAIKVAENLYATGYNRTALGVQSSKAGDNNSLGQYTYGRGNTTTGESGARNWMSNGILALEATNQRRLMDAVGMNEKWADIFSGTVRMATLIGRKLKGYGYQANISGADVDVRGYEYYKGGLFRSNKTVTKDVNSQDADELRQGIENVRESARAMARAMGYSTDAIDGYSGSLKINLKGVKTGEEAAERYGEALDKLQRQMLNSVPGLKMNEEQFKAFIEGITKNMSDVGITAGGIADIITNGMLGRISESQVGEQLSDMVIGGIYSAIAGQYAGQIASVFTSQIIQPIFTAIAAGVPISQAISQMAISNVVATAQKAAATLNAIFADPSFRAAIAGVQQAIAGISVASGSVKAPKYKSAVSSYNAAAEAAKRAAEETKRAWQSVADSLSDEIRRIKGELLGDTSVGQSYYLAQFQEATAKARSGDQDAANMLPELSQAVLDIARSTAGSLDSLQYLQTSTIASLIATREVISKKYGLKLPAFSVGTNYVPKDMIAQIHKGEAIVPAAYNPAAGGAVSGAGILEQAQALREMALALDRLASSSSAIETNTRETRKTLDRVSQGGDALLTVAA